MIHLLNLAKQNRRFFPFFIICLALSLGAAAQMQIKGKVTDAGGSGLPGITVSLQNTTYSSATDVSGNYSLDANVTPGSYQLVFSGVGFKTTTQAIQLTSADNAVNVQLTADALNLDEVVVTGVSAGTTRRQLGSYISTVNADDL